MHVEGTRSHLPPDSAFFFEIIPVLSLLAPLSRPLPHLLDSRPSRGNVAAPSGGSKLASALDMFSAFTAYVSFEIKDLLVKVESPIHEICHDHFTTARCNRRRAAH